MYRNIDSKLALHSNANLISMSPVHLSIYIVRCTGDITGKRDELKSRLHHLQGLELIYEKNLFPDLEYIFKHALTQEVAYNSLLKKRRKAIHKKIAVAMEALFGDRLEGFVEIIAYHYSKSGHLAKSYQYLKLSGDKATNKFSNWEAFQFYKKACSILDKMEDDPAINKNA